MRDTWIILSQTFINNTNFSYQGLERSHLCLKVSCVQLIVAHSMVLHYVILKIDIESVLVALCECTRHIWNISPRTHSDILPHMTGICKHRLTKRFA